MNIESTPLGVECDVRHLPGRHQAKCTSKQDAGWVFQVETSCGNRDPGTIASTHSNQRGASKFRRKFIARLDTRDSPPDAVLLPFPSPWVSATPHRACSLREQAHLPAWRGGEINPRVAGT